MDVEQVYERVREENGYDPVYRAVQRFFPDDTLERLGVNYRSASYEELLSDLDRKSVTVRFGNHAEEEDYGIANSMYESYFDGRVYLGARIPADDIEEVKAVEISLPGFVTEPLVYTVTSSCEGEEATVVSPLFDVFGEKDASILSAVDND